MDTVNWYGVKCDALTAIRINFPVSKLNTMNSEGHDTPVSGDRIAEYKEYTSW